MQNSLFDFLVQKIINKFCHTVTSTVFDQVSSQLAIGNNDTVFLAH